MISETRGSPVPGPHAQGQEPVTGSSFPDADPMARRMIGVTIGGFDLSDVPLVSEIAPGLWQGGSADHMVLPGFIAHLVQLSRRKPCTVAHDLPCPPPRQAGQQDPGLAPARQQLKESQC